MAFCTQCGAQLEEGAKFCTVCGAKQPDAGTPAAPEPSYTYTPPAAPAAGQGAPSYTYDPTVYAGKKEAAPKKKGGKLVVIIIAALAVLAGIIYALAAKSGGSGVKADDPVLGLYTAQKAEAAGMSISVKTMWKNGFTIELKDKGKAEINVDGNKGSAKWTLNGEDFTIKGSGVDCSGTLADGVLTLKDVMGTGVTLYFAKDGVTIPTIEAEKPQASTAPVVTPEPAPAATPEPTPEPKPTYDWWAGDWYGWWVVYDAGGTYLDEGYSNKAWDACAQIEVYGDEGYVKVWDEDGDNVAWADVSFSEGASDRGCMTSLDGKFYNHVITNGEWQIDPALDQTAPFDDLFCIHGFYSQPSNANNWIEYYIFLRPWGTRWEDIDEGDTSGMIYPGDMMPIYYESWYLPLIESGASMPDTFEGVK